MNRAPLMEILQTILNVKYATLDEKETLNSKLWKVTTLGRSSEKIRKPGFRYTHLFIQPNRTQTF